MALEKVAPYNSIERMHRKKVYFEEEKEKKRKAILLKPLTSLLSCCLAEL